jgi:hypothetical protein
MNDEQYLLHCRELLTSFADTLAQRTRTLESGDPLKALAAEFVSLAGGTTAALYDNAGPLITRLFTNYPDFAPTLPRELLWFFAGDCLHYMPDDEIDLYQQLDDMRAAAVSSGQQLDLSAAKAKLLKLQ